MSRDLLLTFCHRVEEQVLQAGEDTGISSPDETRQVELKTYCSLEKPEKQRVILL